jgi:GTP-binding protein
MTTETSASARVRSDLRNIAIIAHVDHGKTTLVDALLKQTNIFRENEQVGSLIMDSNPLEREKGITIMAKNTAIEYRGVRINIIDTPGHADFGGEVERVLNMADGCLLLVDAVEGPMPQTRFVLRKALALGLRAIVVVNKIDRPSARIAEVLSETSDLFLDLATDADQLDFPVVYANARDGYAGLSPDVREGDMRPLLDLIVDHMPAPTADSEEPFALMVAALSYDSFRGRYAVGRITSGTVASGQAVLRAGESEQATARVGQVYRYYGLERVPVDEASAGDIVALTGMGEVQIGDTLTDPEQPRILERLSVELPTMKMTFSVNTSPFAGREGQFVTSRQLRERLYRELETNVALRVEDAEQADSFIVSGRGELHLAILVETLRREGFEFAVSRPEIISRRGEHGLEEPFERVYIEAPEDATGFLIQALSGRKATLADMHSGSGGMSRLTFDVPSRGLIGFRDLFLTGTGGAGLMNSELIGYRPWAGEIGRTRDGALVASESGQTTAYGIANAQERGRLFISPGEQVYEGQVVGINSREQDIAVNVCKQKKLTNIRSSTQDIAVQLVPPDPPSLERSLSLITDDELVEVTPKSLRLRKRYLSAVERDRASKRKDLS